MAIKFDLEKTFDKMDGPLLGKCSMPSIYPLEILVNGTPTFFFEPSRGVRQGDLLSHIYSFLAWNFYPFLFIIKFKILIGL